MANPNWTSEQKKKLSLAHLGKPHPHKMPPRTPGQKAAQSKRQRGKPFPPHIIYPMKESTKRKIALAHIGMPKSEETRRNISIRTTGSGNPMFGKKHSPETIEKLRKASLGKRPSAETREKQSLCRLGEKSHFWRGGVAHEEYGVEFRKFLKRKIRERDNYVCVVCNNPENGKAHDCHHKDYNKKNNLENNLVTLCHSCHSITNTHRDRWIRYFMEEKHA